ncbi:MAG: hypothetical protein ACLSTT_04165 [Evtepia gabavorous]|uniref:hypothetical protein n=1 Tax=Evtepia gabavorous TaxID=2211183 RepID=UPI003A2ABAFC
MENAWFTNLQPMDDRHTKRQQGIILGTGKPPTPHELEKLIDKTIELWHDAVRDVLFRKRI